MHNARHGTRARNPETERKKGVRSSYANVVIGPTLAKVVTTRGLSSEGECLANASFRNRFGSSAVTQESIKDLYIYIYIYI